MDLLGRSVVSSELSLCYSDVVSFRRNQTPRIATFGLVRATPMVIPLVNRYMFTRSPVKFITRVKDVITTSSQAAVICNMIFLSIQSSIRDVNTEPSGRPSLIIMH
ncbi:hypothetical protein H2248_006132 [Termitomyces sp. 'cryptogamus']|nr:hypothetical protein H2248_006132 [Termitomyces sp. 'cryptogamus']